MKEKQNMRKEEKKIQILITCSIVSGTNVEQADFFSLLPLAVSCTLSMKD